MQMGVPIGQALFAKMGKPEFNSNSLTFYPKTVNPTKAFAVADGS